MAEDRLFTVKFDLPEILDVAAEDPIAALQVAWDFVMAAGVAGLNGHEVIDQEHEASQKTYKARYFYIGGGLTEGIEGEEVEDEEVEGP